MGGEATTFGEGRKSSFHLFEVPKRGILFVRPRRRKRRDLQGKSWSREKRNFRGKVFPQRAF